MIKAIPETMVSGIAFIICAWLEVSGQEQLSALCPSP